MLLVNDLLTHIALVAFIGGLLSNHDMHIPIALNCTENYQNAKVLNSRALHMKESKRPSNEHALEAQTQKKNAPSDRSTTKISCNTKQIRDGIGFLRQAPVLPYLTVSRAIYSVTKN